MVRQNEDFYFERPAANERTLVGQRMLPSAQAKLFAQRPRVGLVISTFGAAPFVELGLAVCRRLNVSVPVLVHDDGSPERQALMRLCTTYGATFQCNSSRLGHEMGDLSSIVGGLNWARANGVDLLVKMSRRFIPVTEWAANLQTLAEETQFATYGRPCRSYGLPLRTECFAMAVEPWSRPEVLGEITAFMLKNRMSILLEQYVFHLAQLAYEMNCVAAREWEREHVRATPRPPAIDWPFLSQGRLQKSPNHLWHETTTPEEYSAIGRSVGLSYDAQAFAGYWSQAQI